MIVSVVSLANCQCGNMCECLQCMCTGERDYPASDAGVLWVVFDSDGESVLSHSLSVQWSVHLHHTCLTDTEKKRQAMCVFRDSFMQYLYTL